ncbi:MAG: hypothetical protein KatS3mg052_0040 [Candidatus Roseilinea sp.]|nr:MAG: hypothetical protein KatS3mg052_0040 [Candidatus Roseilinea sp.]
MNLRDKIVVIVGGATGIGKATVEICARAGAAVIVADLNEVEGHATASAVGGAFFPINVADESSVAAAFTDIAAQYGRLDALIQTAGILRGAFVPLEEFDLATFESVVDVNLIGSFLCAKHAVPLLKKAGRGRDCAGVVWRGDRWQLFVRLRRQQRGRERAGHHAGQQVSR